MVTSIYKKAFAVLRQKPVTLWGISLLCGLLELLAFIGFGAVPVGAFIVAWALEAGMAMIYLNSYRTGLKPKSTYLFAAFKKDRFWRVVGSCVDGAVDLPVGADPDRGHRVCRHPRV